MSKPDLFESGFKYGVLNDPSLEFHNAAFDLVRDFHSLFGKFKKRGFVYSANELNTYFRELRKLEVRAASLVDVIGLRE